MHSGIILFCLVMSACVYQYVGYLHDKISYTYIRSEMRTLRGVRLVMVIFIVAFTIELIHRHVTLANLQGFL